MSATEIEFSIIMEALTIVRNVEDYYPPLIIMKLEKPRKVAEKMINGDILNEDEERFLLTKIEQ